MSTRRNTLSSLQLFLVLAVAILLNLQYASSEEVILPSTDEHGDYNGLDLIEWINSHPDGDIHPSVRIGRERPGDPTSINGLFAASDAKPIEKGDIIAQIPWDHMVQPGGKYDSGTFFSCRSIYFLAKELERGEKSTRAPYVRYLLTMPRGIMPGEWTETGQDFLADVLGNGELPPYEDKWRYKFQKEWIEKCSGSEDNEMEHAAYWLAASRDEDTLMVPIYDMANHSNDPKKLNTLSYKPQKAGESFRFWASKEIKPGEQIYNCYNRCNPCSDTPPEDCETYSWSRTPDIFAAFGFVEGDSQSWTFDPAILDSSDDSDDETDYNFCLDMDNETGEWETTWDYGPDEIPGVDEAQWMQKHLQRLKKLQTEKESLEKTLLLQDGGNNSDKKKMTRWEWDSTWRYVDALINALISAIASAEEEIDSGDTLMGDEL